MITINEINRRSLSGWKTEERAIEAAQRLGNVAFVRNGKFMACTRSYVSACINAGQDIKVLADCERD